MKPIGTNKTTMTINHIPKKLRPWTCEPAQGNGVCKLRTKNKEGNLNRRALVELILFPVATFLVKRWEYQYVVGQGCYAPQAAPHPPEHPPAYMCDSAAAARSLDAPSAQEKMTTEMRERVTRITQNSRAGEPTPLFLVSPSTTTTSFHSLAISLSLDSLSLSLAHLRCMCVCEMRSPPHCLLILVKFHLFARNLCVSFCLCVSQSSFVYIDTSHTLCDSFLCFIGNWYTIVILTIGDWVGWHSADPTVICQKDDQSISPNNATTLTERPFL
uniref:Uncharacterized protein n=1 Tax=Nelumbo nucifera TaxID=4432 RepID=A0A822YSG5_NELNU|nr:TPA_asm: hypothetical protein HUJ06_006070 [Nelumbo nucifera]